TQTVGPTVTLNTAQSVKPTFTAPPVTATTGVTFQLVVRAATTTSTPATVTMTVQHHLKSPEPHVATNQRRTAGALKKLNGSKSSNPGGKRLTYAWTQTAGPTVTLNTAQSVKPTFTAPPVTTTTGVTFQLVVSAGARTSTPATVTVTVQQPL